MSVQWNPNDPYPLIKGVSYRDGQEHSEKVDAWLGLRMEETEGKILKGRAQWADHQAWIGLPIQVLLTPYLEIREMLEALSPGPDWTVVDLGAGYGRMGFVLGRHFPEARWIGYELLPERAAEGNRCLREHGIPQARLEVADLSAESFELPEAEAYFIYDYGTREAIEHSLQQIRQVARRKAIAVVGRGRATRDAIERNHPWLSQVIAPEHRGTWSLYRSAA